MEITMAPCRPRDAAGVPVTRRVPDRCPETPGVTPDTRAGIALALGGACAGVVQRAGPGGEGQVRVSARHRQCVIEVADAGGRAGTVRDGRGTGRERPGPGALAGDPVPAAAGRGRGLKIIRAVAGSMQLAGSERHGTTVRFEKTLQWRPGAAGQHLFNAGGDS
jgi:serine/threonine-protein kinase RsbW